MKRILLILLLVVINHWSSFSQDLCADDQCFSATLNGDSFKFRDYWPLHANLIRQQESLDGRQPARTIISIILSGDSYTGTNGKQFNECLQFEIIYEEDKLGEPSIYTVSLQYQSGLYSIIKGRGAFIITGFDWEPGHRSFRLSADIDCILYRWGCLLDGKEDLILSGKLSNILIPVPPWIAGVEK